MRLVTFLQRGKRAVGVVDGQNHVHALSDVLGGEWSDLVSVIERWDELSQQLAGPFSSAGVPIADVELLAPIPLPRRNIFCVGKNYVEHAREFASSGYDQSTGSSPADHLPKSPVVFTKPPSSVVGPDAEIDPHLAVTKELDYEAELAVIIGRGGVDIPAAEALQHVWGYTIVNDVTARDRQRDHKQWFLGKGLDTFCPMGPYAVSADVLDGGALQVECRVNGEIRQSASTADLLFDIPTLIETLSAGMTLLPGDIIATGTPAGVGIGFTPPRFLRGGDLVEISITGLGTLSNRVAKPASPAAVSSTNSEGTLMKLSNGKELFVETAGEGPAVLFVHGLGGTTNFYEPQASALASRHRVVRFDLPGAGRSPFAGPCSIESFADDIEAVMDATGLQTASIVGHSMGTVAVQYFAATRPERVEKIVLLGPVREQAPAGKEATRQRAGIVREQGMQAVADAIVGAATSEETRTKRPAVAAFVRELISRQDPQGYAAHCEALADATAVDLGKIEAPVLLLTGSEDKVGSPATAEAMFNDLPKASYEVIDGIGHWTAIEAADRVTKAIADFLA
jgi:2-keto-4-pentenoate hydratase/2-oxohepta-3-ene-1,7-dioic acid hydratase in catechol pathway/pimeloyl-ACP methyl ester carboxylesterase